MGGSLVSVGIQNGRLLVLVPAPGHLKMEIYMKILFQLYWSLKGQADNTYSSSVMPTTLTTI
jgi:hypothetical protein